MNKKAFIVGINYKDSNNELYGCINDAENMREYLTFNEYTNIKILSDNTDEKPTRENILNGMRWLIENSSENDTLFFHYSGHGTNTMDYSGDEIDGLDEAICPLDFSSGLITDDDIYKIFSQGKGKIICVFDCCHSGTIMDLKYNYKQIGENIINIITNKKSGECFPKILCISGCMDNQTSADTVMINLKINQEQSQGALSGLLLEILNSRKNEYISYKSLMSNLLKNMRKNGYSQIPQFSSNVFLDLREKWNI